MAIFSRRSLQRLINENATFLRAGQTKNHVQRLNNDDLGAEWEVVLLNVFAKLGSVEHEPRLPNSKKKIDLQYQSSQHEFLRFLADITTLSDRGIETQNPVREFEDRMFQVMMQNGIRGAWRYDIGGNAQTEGIHGLFEGRELPSGDRWSGGHQFFDKYNILWVAICSEHKINCGIVEHSRKEEEAVLDLSEFFSQRTKDFTRYFIRILRPNNLVKVRLILGEPGPKVGVILDRFVFVPEQV